MKEVSFREYIHEVLKNAIYEPDDSLKVPCVVAEAPDLPGCFTQGENFEEARENLIAAIELWIMAGLKNGETMPIVNGCKLAMSQKGSIMKSSKEEALG
jgi:predicted RNase H-like HicB family nuclease